MKKCSIALRHIAILATLMLVAVCSVKAQNVRKLDTVKVIMLISDTSKKNAYYLENPADNGRTVMTYDRNYAVNWRFGYSVREIHNESEDYNDWYFSHPFRKPKDYGVHLYYLMVNKEPLPNYFFVWQSIDVK